MSMSQVGCRRRNIVNWLINCEVGGETISSNPGFVLITAHWPKTKERGNCVDKESQAGNTDGVIV